MKYSLKIWQSATNITNSTIFNESNDICAIKKIFKTKMISSVNYCDLIIITNETLNYTILEEYEKPLPFIIRKNAIGGDSGILGPGMIMCFKNAIKNIENETKTRVISNLSKYKAIIQLVGYYPNNDAVHYIGCLHV